MIRALFIISITLLTSCANISGHNFNGIYKSKLEDGVYSTLTIKEINKEQVAVSLECNGGSPSYNSGLLESDLKIHNNVATYKEVFIEGETCEVAFHFLEGSIEVKQVSGYGQYCGFGLKVTCDGVYQKQVP